MPAPDCQRLPVVLLAEGVLGADLARVFEAVLPPR
jgi:hypothetical protein